MNDDINEPPVPDDVATTSELSVEPDDAAASTAPELPRPRKRTIGLAVALALLCIIATSVTAYVAVKGGFRQAIAPLFKMDLPAKFGKDKLRILVMGVDDSWTTNDEVYTSQSRSDTNIAVSIDLHSHNVGVLSIPRDLWVDIPKDGYGKLNEAIADGGPERSEATIERNPARRRSTTTSC